jgi:phosphate starvation-inducible PhoH-like protein
MREEAGMATDLDVDRVGALPRREKGGKRRRGPDAPRFVKNVQFLTPNQKLFVEVIRANALSFGVGPAGTGKTYLAVSEAVESFNAGDVERIVISRPVVEAALEKIGFLPGDLNQKLDPWMRPIFDVLYERMGASRVRQEMQEGKIEIAPLAFMRGRTFRSAFVVLDEAANVDAKGLAMVIGRLGFASKMVVVGDPAQCDLLPGMSGLAPVIDALRGCDGVGVAQFTDEDIVRHPLLVTVLPRLASLMANGARLASPMSAGLPLH